MAKSKRPKTRPSHEPVTAEKDPATLEPFTVERGIDAIDRLRVLMRQAGMIECARSLDQTFIRCLRDYVTRVAPEAPGAVDEQKRGDKLN